MPVILDKNIFFKQMCQEAFPVIQKHHLYKYLGFISFFSQAKCLYDFYIILLSKNQKEEITCALSTGETESLNNWIKLKYQNLTICKSSSKEYVYS